MPFVSVIVPNYNHEQYLAKRLDTVFSQTFQDFEVIILDDCSTDGSRELIAQYRGHPKVSHIILNETNAGTPFKQWMKGIPLALGKYLWIAESDDYAENDLLQKLVDLALQHDNVGIAFCNSNWVDNKGSSGPSLSLYKEAFVRKGMDEIRTLLKFNTIQNASAALIRTDLAKASIPGIERFRSCGDWYFYINILKSSNIAYTPEILNHFRWYHSNTSNKAKENDWWVTEGSLILSSLDREMITLDKPYLSHLLVFWTGRIRDAKKLSWRDKVRSWIHVMRFYLNFVVSS